MFTIIAKDSESRARAGELYTRHGVVKTPAYVIVGTHAAVRAISHEDLKNTKTQIIIANTYHLWRMLGDEGLNRYAGVHNALGWNGATMTDSGGFQVFSLGAAREQGVGKVMPQEGERAIAIAEENLVRITDEGVWFYDNGEELYLDAEKSIDIQQKLGADIIVAFDECTSPLHSYEYTKKSLVRTHAWAARSLKARTSRQFLFGVVQGGAFQDLRQESACVIGAMPFDGYAIGGAFGSSFGSSAHHTFEELDWVVPLLPEDRPRHLLGIGKIVDLFEGVARGIDTFDCVIPTREARHGRLWTLAGPIDIHKGRYADDSAVIDVSCTCPVCAVFKAPRGHIRALFKEKNPESGRLATLHNMYFFNDLMQKIREAILEGRFLEFKTESLRQFRRK